MGVSWKRRYVQLGQMQRSLRMLHGEIRYTGAELPEAIDQIALRQEKPFSDFYHGLSEQMRRMDGQSLKTLWQTEIEKCLNNTYLTKEDKQIFLESGSQLGYLDRQMQLSSLEACMAQIEDNQNMIQEKYEGKTETQCCTWTFVRFFYYNPVNMIFPGRSGMTVNVIFKIAAVGILISVLNQILKHSGRDDQAFLTSLAGLILVLMWIIPYIYELFQTIQQLFAL